MTDQLTKTLAKLDTVKAFLNGLEMSIPGIVGSIMILEEIQEDLNAFLERIPPTLPPIHTGGREI